jgi:hypothetical protein
MGEQPTNFTEWLIKNYAEQETPIGDLARGVARDRTWPIDANTEQQFLSYLRRTVAPPGAIRAFRSAWKAYTRTR